jgi:hypothetical protein
MEASFLQNRLMRTRPGRRPNEPFATILSLSALRREGHALGAWPFLKLGLVAMPMALLPALSIVSLF